MDDTIQAQLATARRGQILAAATQAFAEKGFHPTTIHDIAQRAGVADGTIYNYFANKTALLFGVLDRLRESVKADAVPVRLEDRDLRGFLQAYLTQPLLAFRADNFELFRVIMSEIMVNPELRARYYEDVFAPTVHLAEAQLAQWAAQGKVRPLDGALIMRGVSGMILGLMIQHVMGDETLQSRWDELPGVLADFILSGLTAGDA